ncbi:hypothetical protein JXL21_01805 [Candidatus Bathyarchaeota archaeon]|nr:hypothetical protein [Candidatus Bathyarchaeota archaeon]
MIPSDDVLRAWLNEEAGTFLAVEKDPLPIVFKVVDEFIYRIRSYTWDTRDAKRLREEQEFSEMTMKVLTKFLG